MAVTAQIEGLLKVNDDEGRDVIVEAEQRTKHRISFRWPCGARYSVDRGELRRVLDTLESLPKLRRPMYAGVVHESILTYSGDQQYKFSCRFTLMPNGGLHCFTDEEGDGATLKIRDLRKALDL